MDSRSCLPGKLADGLCDGVGAGKGMVLGVNGGPKSQRLGG